MGIRECAVYERPDGTLIIDNSRYWAERLANAMGEGVIAEYGGVQGGGDYSKHVLREGAQKLGVFHYQYSEGVENGHYWLLDPYTHRQVFSGYQKKHGRQMWEPAPTREELLRLVVEP